MNFKRIFSVIFTLLLFASQTMANHLNDRVAQLKIGAEAGDAEASNSMAEMYLEGADVLPNDVIKSFELCKKQQL